VSLRLANGPLAAPVLGSRDLDGARASQLPHESGSTNAMILCDTLSAHAPAHARDGHLAFTIETDRQGIEMRVGELTEQGATKLLADAAVPGVGNVLERLSDELRIEPSSAGEKREELVLALRFG